MALISMALDDPRIPSKGLSSKSKYLPKCLSKCLSKGHRMSVEGFSQPIIGYHPLDLFDTFFYNPKHPLNLVKDSQTNEPILFSSSHFFTIETKRSLSKLKIIHRSVSSKRKQSIKVKSKSPIEASSNLESLIESRKSHRR